MNDSSRNVKIEALIRLLAGWVARNPDAVAGDAAGEDLLDLVRRIAILKKDFEDETV
jgi:hypothetical protein